MKSIGRARVIRAALISIAALGSLMGDAFAEGQGAGSGSSAIERRWIPGGSLYTMGQAEQRTATMSADTPIKPGQPNLDGDGQTLGLPWSFGGTLDLASPVILDAPGRLRLFAHADAGYTYDLSDPVATQGDPGLEPSVPPNQGNATAAQHVGASVRVEAKPLVFSGGIGTVFEIQAFDHGFRLRPTLEWMYRRDTMRVLLGSAETEASSGTVCNPACRTLFVKAQTEKGFHSLGPGFEIETDVGRLGDFLVGWYGSFRAYYLIGDRKANLGTTGSWKRTDDQPTSRPDTTFFTEYERDPWHYRFGMGIRVLWSPEE